MSTQSCDVVVIGAGTSGSTVAGRLAAAGLDVVIVEAGPDPCAGDARWPEYEAVRDPVRMHELWDSRLDWGWRTVPQADAHGRRLHIPRGKVVGGSHALNAMIWVRGAPADYDRWAAAGNPTWSWAQVAPVYDAMEARIEEAGDTTSLAGPIDILTGFEPLGIQQAIVTAAVSAGIPFNPDYNSGTLEGVSYMQYTIRAGRRHMTSDAFLGPQRGSGKLTVVSEALADRVIVENGHAIGVTVHREGMPELIRAEAVVLAAGALATPAILLRSGVGPGADLHALGIPVKADLPGVGANLQDHWLVPVAFSGHHDLPPHVGTPLAQTHLWARSRPDLELPDLQPIHFAAPLVPEGVPEISAGFALMAGLVRPFSSGSVRLADADPSTTPLIDPRVLHDPRDVAALGAAVELCLTIGEQPSLALDHGARAVYPTPEQRSGPGLVDYIRSAVVTYHHASGTAKMGTDDHAVVDGDTLAVHGVENLHVCDTSVFPDVPTGNTNAPAALVGWRGADLVLASSGRGR